MVEIERFFEQKQEAPLLSKETIGKQNIVLFDRDRNGIFIHRGSLAERSFTIGDRFSIHKGRRELFSLKIKKDDQGDILLDKNGIFISRSPRVDILLGGIYEAFVLDLPNDDPEVIILRPR